MGKAVKKVLKVAAFVGIAVFAAPVAAAIGLSAAVGTIAGAAIVGAAAGAATNGILGGGVLKGALMGGLGGAIGGVGKVLSTPGTGLFGDAYAASNVVPGVAEGAGAAAGASAGAGTTAAATEAAYDGITVVANTAPAAISGATALGGAALGGAAAGLAAGGGGAGGGTATTTGTTAPDGTIVVNAPPQAPAAAISGTAANVGAGVGGAATGVANAGLDLGGGYNPPNEQAVSDAGRAPFGAGTVNGQPIPAAAAAGAGGGAISNSGGLLGGLAGTALDVAKVVAPPLIAGALVPGVDTTQQKDEITDQQKQDLADQTKQYNDNFNLKTGYAQGLIDDANQYDPEVAGRRAAEAARIRAGLSARNAARGAGGRRAEVIQRQGDIEGGRAATRGYWDAYGTTGAQRVQTRAAGINAIPLGTRPSASDYSGIYGNLTAQETARDADVAGVSDILGRGFGAVLGTNRNEDELARARAG